MLFGYEGELASKNIKRNGAKGFVITVSMAVSIVLLLSVTYLVELYNKEKAKEGDQTKDLKGNGDVDVAGKIW